MNHSWKNCYCGWKRKRSQAEQLRNHWSSWNCPDVVGLTRGHTDKAGTRSHQNSEKGFRLRTIILVPARCSLFSLLSVDSGVETCFILWQVNTERKATSRWLRVPRWLLQVKHLQKPPWIMGYGQVKVPRPGFVGLQRRLSYRLWSFYLWSPWSSEVFYLSLWSLWFLSVVFCLFGLFSSPVVVVF